MPDVTEHPIVVGLLAAHTQLCDQEAALARHQGPSFAPVPRAEILTRLAVAREILETLLSKMTNGLVEFVQ